MNNKQTVKVSKFMSFALRHDPKAAGITLDSNGWVKVSELIKAIKNHGYSVNLKDIEFVVENNDKKRFQIVGDKIRASQGHSVDIDLNLTPTKPPKFLYHGTALKNVDSIYENGINSGNRQHVHLSVDRETAVKVGSRHGKPYIFIIDSEKMYEDGVDLYISENGVWLVKSVERKYISSDFKD